jgi:hypothetical protein
MKRLWIVALALLVTSACGGQAASPPIHITMTQALAAKVETIYLAALDGSRACSDLVIDRGNVPSFGICTGEDPSAGPPCVLAKASVKVLDVDLADPITLYVPAGERTIVAVGLDTGEQVVAFDCAGPVNIEPGSRTPVELTLDN